MVASSHPTEAAAVSVVYGLFVGMVIYREVSFRDLFDILIDSAKTTGGIMLIVACASLFSFVCTKIRYCSMPHQDCWLPLHITSLFSF